tara:strand:+ start:1331 stop:2683 length:1353 start_codon:yes stop_codon:yes gene_type:complete
MQNAKKIMLLLPTGMTIRNLLNTDIVKNILEKSSHEIICCINNPEKYHSYFEHERIQYINFYEKTKYSFSNLLMMVLRRRFYAINENRTLTILKKNPFAKNNLKDKIFSFLSYPFPKSKTIFNSLKFLQKSIYFSSIEIKSQFEHHKPDLIFSTHLVARHEYGYLMEAKKRNIPTIGMVKSFDNLTGKGFIPYKTDYAIVWNDILKDELISIYEYDESNISVTGVPQFDIYKNSPKISKYEFFKKYNLTKNMKVILFATNSQLISPDDFEYIEFLASKLIELNAQMIVRIHPTDHIGRYKGAKFKNVCFQIPGVEDGDGPNERVAAKKFLEDLSDTLYFSDVTINTASTMSLDAIAHDKPVINIAFDMVEKPYFKSVERYYEFVHYQPIIDSNATSIAKNKIELYEYLKSYLNNSDQLKVERQNLRNQMLAGQKGDASKKIVESILQILN